MKQLITLMTILFISFLSSPSWSETLDDLVVRDGIWYKKFTDVPFTGKIKGRIIGGFINGKFDGLFVHYWENGQLQTKGVYKNGKKEGKWVYYFNTGKPFASMTGIFKNGVKQ